MSLTKFEIKLHNPTATYSPGELISGEVIVELNRTKTFRGLKLKFKGQAKVHWQENHGSGKNSRSVRYSAQEDYFRTDVYILGGSEGQIDLEPGHHIFPFTFALPRNIPNSFEHQLGEVRYSIKAVIDRPWKFDHETTILFTVESPLDLCQHPSTAIDDEVHENYCCCLCPCIGQGSMTAQIHIPTNTYAVGENLEVFVDVNNTSQAVDVTRVKLRLEQILEFNARSPTNKTKRADAILQKTKKAGPFPKRADVRLGLQVPSVLHSGFQYCGIIDVRYRVHVLLGVSGCHCGTEKKYDILIGSKSAAAFAAPTYNPSAPPSAPGDFPSSPFLSADASSAVPMPYPMAGPSEKVAPSNATPYPPYPSHPMSVNPPYPTTANFPYPAAPPVGFLAANPSAPMDIAPEGLPPSYESVMAQEGRK